MVLYKVYSGKRGTFYYICIIISSQFCSLSNLKTRGKTVKEVEYRDYYHVLLFKHRNSILAALLLVITNDWQYYIQKQKMFDDEEDSSERLQQYLANQRTFLSWVRTSIALIALGFAIERFSLLLQQFRLIADTDITTNAASATANEYSALVGIGMIVVGTSLIVYALKNYLDTNKTIASGKFMTKNAIVYATSTAIIGLGIIMIIFLVGQLL